MKKYESVVNEKILNAFSEIRGRSLINHVSNSYDIEMAIGFASLYCPEVIEIDDCIFIAEFYNGNIDRLKAQYKSRKEIEIFVNSWSLTSLLSNNEKINYNVDYIDEFAKAIQYFWQMRIKELFPNRKVIVEIGEGIMGESGLAVTVYQEQ
jgi:hypothetical protein